MHYATDTALRDTFFDIAFRELTDHRPFRWQRRLFLEHFAHGAIPSAIDIPTGLGKTAVMAIWLIALAKQAEEGLLRLPRRLIYVVDRRVVVDQASTVAQRIRDRLVQVTDGPLLHIRKVLGLGGDLLPVSTLRGGRADNREWLYAPERPAIVVGTVDMIGSRLLFSGYGVSPGMRPVHAGLLGVDTLFVLDEAHLVPPFEALMERITASRTALGEPAEPLAPAPRSLALSATGRSTRKPFSITDEDLNDEPTRDRLYAVKHVEVRASSELVSGLVSAAMECAYGSDACPDRRILVFCDRRKDAEGVAGRLRKDLQTRLQDRSTRKSEARQTARKRVMLLTGARRGLERERDAQTLEELGFLADTAPADQNVPAFVVATSAGEVGIDLDADHMVCDLVEWERMVQRLGRVNRRGKRPDTRVVVLTRDDGDEDERRGNTRDLLERLAAMEGGASPANILGLIRTLGSAAITAASTPSPLNPLLEQAHVEDWASTSIDSHPGRARVAPWLRGRVEEKPQARIAWRHHLPWPEGATAPSADTVEAYFRLARVHRIEILETHVKDIGSKVRRRAVRVLEAEGTEDDRPAAIVLSPSARFRAALTVSELAGDWRGPLPGDLLVLSDRLGGLDGDGFLSESAHGPVACVDSPHPEVVWSQPELSLLSEILGFVVTDSGDLSAVPEGWQRVLSLPLSETEDEVVRELTVWMPPGRAPAELVAGKDVPLRDHLDDVAREAAQLAHAVDLHVWPRNALIAAARLHDIGKARKIWQDFALADGAEVLAKSKRGYRHGRFLNGYRHEFGSLVDIDAGSGPLGDLVRDVLASLGELERELTLHLVAAHHGGGRPLIEAVDETVLPTAASRLVKAQALRFARLQRHFGPWTLAWLEALLRTADWRASAAETGNAGGLVDG